MLGELIKQGRLPIKKLQGLSFGFAAVDPDNINSFKHYPYIRKQMKNEAAVVLPDIEARRRRLKRLQVLQQRNHVSRLQAMSQELYSPEQSSAKTSTYPEIP